MVLDRLRAGQAQAGGAGRMDDAVRSCLFAVVDRFNTEDPFWSSFVPAPESTTISRDGFSVTLHGMGVELEVVGALVLSPAAPGGIAPSVNVGGRSSAAHPPLEWHPVTCTVDSAWRFVTSDFRKAIEASIQDVRVGARR